MDPSTIQYYNDSAPDVAARYEAADMDNLHHILLEHLPTGARVLEIGCGSGRDAAFLLAQGYDVTAVDASRAMLAAARVQHPLLRDRLYEAALPFSSDSHLLDSHYEGIVSVATIMHIADCDLPTLASQMRDMLVPNGVLIISASTARDGIVDSRDADGRLFIERPPERLRSVFQSLGFRLIRECQDADSFARGVEWYTLVMQRGGD